MSGLQDLSLEQAAALIASRVRVKQASDSTLKPELSQSLQRPTAERAASGNATSPAQGEPDVMDRVRAALGNIDFGALANKGMDAAKGFSPVANPLHAALLGGGLGMGVGALGSLTSSDKEKRKRWLRNALFGGAMGGIGGAGLHAAMNYGNKLVTDDTQRRDEAYNAPQVPTLADRLSHVANGLGLSAPQTPPTAGAAGAAAGGKSNAIRDAYTAATRGVGAAANKVVDTLSPLPPAMLVGGGAIGGNLVDRAMNNSAVNAAKNTTLRESLHNKAFQPFIDKANAGLVGTGQPAVSQEQQSAFINPPAKPGVLTQLQQGVNDSASAVKNTAKEFLTRTYPITRKPPRPVVDPATGYHPTPTPTPKPTVPNLTMSSQQLKALHAANAAYMSPEAKKAIPRQRGGAYGTMLGAGLGAALSMAGTPRLSQAQKDQQAATPPKFQ